MICFFLSKFDEVLYIKYVMKKEILIPNFFVDMGGGGKEIFKCEMIT